MTPNEPREEAVEPVVTDDDVEVEPVDERGPVDARPDEGEPGI